MRKLPFGLIGIVLTLGVLCVSGCAVTGRQSLARWAMDDPDYASEHDKPYSADPQGRQTQQQFDRTDASFQEGKSGAYVGGGSSVHGRPVATGSIGISKMPTSCSTVRYGVFGMDDTGIGVGGFEGGLRLHAPTRFTPYIGVSADAGFSSLHNGRSHYRYNTSYPYQGQTVTQASGLLAIVPEAGVSYWLNSSTRLNAGASYYVPVNQSDFLVFGLSLEFLSRKESKSSGDVPIRTGAGRPELTDEYVGSSAPNRVWNDRLAKHDQHQDPAQLEQVTGVPLPEYDGTSNSSLTTRINETHGTEKFANDLPEPLTPASKLFDPDSIRTVCESPTTL